MTFCNYSMHYYKLPLMNEVDPDCRVKKKTLVLILPLSLMVDIAGYAVGDIRHWSNCT